MAFKIFCERIRPLKSPTGIQWALIRQFLGQILAHPSMFHATCFETAQQGQLASTAWNNTAFKVAFTQKRFGFMCYTGLCYQEGMIRIILSCT